MTMTVATRAQLPAIPDRAAIRPGAGRHPSRLAGATAVRCSHLQPITKARALTKPFTKADPDAISDELYDDFVELFFKLATQRDRLGQSQPANDPMEEGS
jgi:hypothetical protein